MLCTRCKKRMAVVFISAMQGEEHKNEGLCLVCAKELGLPQVDEYIKQMGIDEDDIEMLSDQLMEITDGEAFELGGAETMPNFLQNIFGSDMLKSFSEKEKSQNEPPKRERKKKSSTKRDKKRKFLDQYCVDLTKSAREGELDSIIGRDKEIYRVTQILSRRTKNNPCLIGEPGVGKTAIAEGIAQKIVAGDVPFRLAEKELFLLDLTALVAGTQFRGQFESRVKGLIDEVKAAGNIILFIDEVHNLVGTGDSEGSMNAANILKPALSRGEVQVVGATTFTEYRKHIEKDSALERRFQPVTVTEPNIEETIEVLKGIKGYYEAHHKIKISDSIIASCASLSERYITDRFLPDKAIDLMDEAAACASIKSTELTEYEKLNAEYKKQLDEEKELEEASGEVDYERLAIVKSDVLKTKERLKELEQVVGDIEVTLEDVSKVIELWTGIPAIKIMETEFKKMGKLEDILKSKIIGQDEAVRLVSNAIKRSRVQLSKRRRPSSFIFVGPTGVGKTELVKVLANELFDTVDPLIRLDMSEFMEKHAVSRLIGSPPGYVGYDEAGQLTEKVRRKPYSVVLFDEIEKAHPDVMNILLQILDEGKVTDAQGRTVNFENTVIAMTSNAGSTDKNTGVGFNRSAGDISKERSLKGLSDFLRPEFLSRVDEIVVFKPLSVEDYKKIAALMLDEIIEPLAEREIKFSYDDAVLDIIAKKSHGGKFGARDIRSNIRKLIEDKVANTLVDMADNPPRIMKVTVKEGGSSKTEDDIEVLAL